MNDHSSNTDKEFSRLIITALQSGFIRSEDTTTVFLDITRVRNRLGSLISAFPENTLHCVAIKAMPLPALLRKLVPMGIGAEVASLPELHIALAAGFSAEKIVFDSPAKTRSELAFALEKGVHINADSLDELARISELRKSISSQSTIGIRINPQVGTGKIKETSTAGEWSKFGVPLSECKDALIEAFKSYPWLSVVHMHIGSQGMEQRYLEEAARRLSAFTELINEGGSQIRTVNIGGGLPTVYRQGDPVISAAQYRQALENACPILFNGSIRLATEFGRWTFASAGWILTKVEYVKHHSGRNTAIIHAGADLLLRECYQPDYWHHEVLALDGKGNTKPGSVSSWTLAGPLCFSGDIPVKNFLLPELQEGDYLILKDTGAYTFSMWSHYNSRQFPRVIGYTGEKESFEILKERESPEDAATFWV